MCTADNRERMDLKRQTRAENRLLPITAAPSIRQGREHASSITVAIVDDDELTGLMLVDWIQQAQGFRCVGVHGSGESALAALPVEKPAVVLMDINLPGMNGIDCVRRLKALMPETQFVMFTVSADSNHIFEALAAGASGYLRKQTPLPDLLAAIKQVHEGGSPMTSDIARKVVQSFQLLPADKAGPGLSPREWEVMQLLARGFAYKEIADMLQIGVTTVNTHIQRIYEKLHVRSSAQAVAVCSQSIRGREFWRQPASR